MLYLEEVLQISSILFQVMFKKDQFNSKQIQQACLLVMDILQMELKLIKFSILCKMGLFTHIMHHSQVTLLVNRINIQFVHFITQPQIHSTGKSIAHL